MDDDPLIVLTTFISDDKDGEWSLSPRLEPNLRAFTILKIIELTNFDKKSQKLVKYK